MAQGRFQALLDVALAASGSGKKKVRQRGITRSHLPHASRERHLREPRIHGELKILGFDITDRTMLRWVRKAQRIPSRQSDGQRF